MTQSLQRRHPFSRINLEYLLHEVNELKDLPPFTYSVLERHFYISRRIDMLFLELENVPLFKELAKVEERVVPLRYLNLIVVLGWYLGGQELLEGFEVVALLAVVPVEEAVSVDRVVDQLLWRKATELHGFEELVVIILPWEDGRFDEEFNGSTAKGPHVDALIVGWYLSLSLAVGARCCNVSAQQNFRSSVISRLDVGVHLMALEGCTAKIYKF